MQGAFSVGRIRSAAKRDQTTLDDARTAAPEAAHNGFSQQRSGRSTTSADVVSLDSAARIRSSKVRPAHSVAAMKARQVAKMREIYEALVAEGCVSLDEQAAALGLPRSTTWTIVTGSHKSSGLSATIVKRMLSAPRLQRSVRKKILEYVEEKCAGHYGGSKDRLQKFVDRVKRDRSATRSID